MSKTENARIRRPPQVKSSKADIHARFHKIPRLRFCEDRRLTSYSGLVVFQALFRAMRLRARIRACFRHLGGTRIFGHASVVVLLVVHIILGFRRLRRLDYYRDDPLVARVCGVRRLPDVATVSRTLASFDDESVEGLRELNREIVIDRLPILSQGTPTLLRWQSWRQSTHQAIQTASVRWWGLW